MYVWNLKTEGRDDPDQLINQFLSNQVMPWLQTNLGLVGTKKLILTTEDAVNLRRRLFFTAEYTGKCPDKGRWGLLLTAEYGLLAGGAIRAAMHELEKNLAEIPSEIILVDEPRSAGSLFCPLDKRFEAFAYQFFFNPQARKDRGSLLLETDGYLVPQTSGVIQPTKAHS